MIKALYTLLYRRELVPDDDADSKRRALQLATAALLMEVADADYDVSDAERDAIRKIVEEKFSITPDEAEEIAARAEQDAGHVTSLYPFTRKIVAECSMDERIEIIGMLWQVTAVDGCIDAHEEHLVRKIAKLLYVPHGQFIRMRHKHDKY